MNVFTWSGVEPPSWQFHLVTSFNHWLFGRELNLWSLREPAPHWLSLAAQPIGSAAPLAVEPMRKICDNGGPWLAASKEAGVWLAEKRLDTSRKAKVLILIPRELTLKYKPEKDWFLGLKFNVFICLMFPFLFKNVMISYDKYLKPILGWPSPKHSDFFF